MQGTALVRRHAPLGPRRMHQPAPPLHAHAFTPEPCVEESRWLADSSQVCRAGQAKRQALRWTATPAGRPAVPCRRVQSRVPPAPMHHGGKARAWKGNRPSATGPMGSGRGGALRSRAGEPSKRPRCPCVAIRSNVAGHRAATRRRPATGHPAARAAARSNVEHVKRQLRRRRRVGRGGQRTPPGAGLPRRQQRRLHQGRAAGHAAAGPHGTAAARSAGRCACGRSGAHTSPVATAPRAAAPMRHRLKEGTSQGTAAQGILLPS